MKKPSEKPEGFFAVAELLFPVTIGKFFNWAFFVALGEYMIFWILSNRNDQ